MIGLELMQETENKVNLIKDKLKATSNRQNLYADLKQEEIEYVVGFKIFLKVSPWKKNLHFGRKGKLSSIYRFCT